MSNQKVNILDITPESLKKGAFRDHIPEYYELENVVEHGLWHNKQKVSDHVAGVLKGLNKVLLLNNLQDSTKKLIEEYLSKKIHTKTRKEILMLATLLHDIAKVDTLLIGPDGAARCPAHELIGAGRVCRFSERFGFSVEDESYVERIVRYHGFISDLLTLIIGNEEREKYLKIFEETVGDIMIELILLMWADLLGSDLEAGDRKAYDQRIDILEWMFSKVVTKL